MVKTATRALQTPIVDGVLEGDIAGAMTIGTKLVPELLDFAHLVADMTSTFDATYPNATDDDRRCVGLADLQELASLMAARLTSAVETAELDGGELEAKYGPQGSIERRIGQIERLINGLRADMLAMVERE